MIAGGGTGGHIFPAIAVARQFKDMDAENDVLFIGSRNGIEARVLPDEGWALKFISAGALKGRGLIGILKGLFRTAFGVMESLSLIRRYGPDVILGVGGYVSAPVVLAGRLAGVRTAIHEQNAMPGMTNRTLGKIVNRVFITYPESKSFFASVKVVLTGNPVRSDIRKTTVSEQEEKNKKDGITLLIFGGSRGAASINRVATEAFTSGVLQGVNIIHQTGDDDFEKVERMYRESGVKARVVPFIKDMAAAYRESDLALCRAGATTIAELVSAGKPSILVPYPFASDDHQTVNAMAMVRAGAAVMIADSELSAGRLGEEIARFCANPEILAAMGKKARMMDKGDAAETICKELIALAA